MEDSSWERLKKSGCITDEFIHIKDGLRIHRLFDCIKEGKPCCYMCNKEEAENVYDTEYAYTEEGEEVILDKIKGD
jgi:hypothetical protein